MTQATRTRTVYLVVCFEMQGNDRFASIESRHSSRKAAENACIRRGSRGYGVFTQKQYEEEIDADTIYHSRYNEFFN